MQGKSNSRDKVSAPKLEKFSNYYPSDLMHGILAAHCADESGIYAGKSKIKKDDKVEFSSSNTLYQYLIQNNDLNLNDYAKGWRAIELVEDAQTGYLGIIYCNDPARQLVLAHRSTNFALAFTRDNFFKQCGMQADFDGVVKGIVTSHQGNGYVATKKAIEVAKTEKYSAYSLSTTGHSLGAWLAQLSTFYAARDFGYNLRSVDFDGPGSREMIEEMIRAAVDHKFKVQDLDITSYLSAPNIVNCSNKHLGDVYRLLVNIPNDHKSAQSFLGLFGKEAIFNTIFGHDLIYIIPYFDKNTGKPIECRKVTKWPSITYKAFGAQGSETTSFGSLIQLAKTLIAGKMNQNQFWLAHKYLDKNNKYIPKPEIINDETNNFKLAYMGNYEVKEAQLYKRAVKDSIDKQLAKLKNKIVPIIGELTVPEELYKSITALVAKYKVQLHPSKNIIIEDEYQNLTTISCVREMMREISHRQKESYEKLIEEFYAYSVKGKQLLNNRLISHLPFESLKDYVEPVETFKIIDNILNIDQKAIVSAFAGSGKTSCALEYGYKEKRQGKIVRWFDSSSKEKLDLNYKVFAEMLGIDVISLDQSMIINLVNNKIEHCSKEILFIFDNVEKETKASKEPGYLKDYLTNLPSKVRVLITTRDTKLFPAAKKITVKLQPFSRDEAVQYVKAKLKKKITLAQAEELISELNILPLKLNNAVAYLKENTALKASLTNDELKEFIKIYRETDSATNLLLRSVSVMDNIKVWQLLQYAAYLDPDFINIEIMKKLVEKDENILAGYIEELRRSSLITKVSGIDKSNFIGLKIHRLTQEDIKEYRDKFAEQKIDETVLKNNMLIALNELLPNLTSLPGKDWQMAENLLANVLSLLGEDTKYNQSTFTNAVHAELYTKVANYYEYAIYDFQKSLRYHQRALGIYKILYNDNHPNIATALNNIGVIYQKKGELKDSFVYLQQALKMRQKIYQGNHADIATSLNDIGIYYKEKRDLENALTNLSQALKMRQILYRDAHPELAMSLNNLGIIYKEKEDIPNASNYLKQALEMWKVIYGSDHPDIATSLNNVGICYQEEKRFETAIDFLTQALEMRKKLYQGNHPDIADSLNNLGLCLQESGNIERALSHLKLALAMRQSIYSGNHPEIADSLKNIAMCYQHEGNLENGISFQERSLIMKQALHFNNNFDLANLLNNLGLFHYNLGDRNKGLEYVRQSYHMSCKIFDKNHPNVKRLEGFLLASSPGVNNANDKNRELIKHCKVSDGSTLKIKKLLQVDVLNKISDLAKVGTWDSGLLSSWVAIRNWGVNGYTSREFLAKKLGTNSTDASIEIAQMLCFEAICLGVMQSQNRDLTCAKKFAEAYPSLIKKIADNHPEYFVDGNILRACIANPELIAKLLGNDSDKQEVNLFSGHKAIIKSFQQLNHIAASQSGWAGKVYTTIMTSSLDAW